MVRFQDIYGNKDVVRQLTTALRSGNISHAYLLCGEQGSGKRMLADAFVAALLCESGGTEACGRCRSCLQAASGNHPDIIHVTHEKAQISVNDIREQLNANAAVKPYSSPYKVFVIDEAELMNEAAQNALLKTLEEPPEYVVIILLSESEDVLLPTVRSRCVRLSTRPLAHSEVTDYLIKNRSIPDYLASAAAAFSGGNLGKAVEFIESEEAAEKRSKALNLLRHLDDLSVAEIMSEIKEIKEREEFLDLLLVWLRDAFVFKSTGKAKRLILQNEESDIERYAKLRSYEALQHETEQVMISKERLNSNVSPDVVMEMLVLSLKER